jgi:prepilin-type N-terminal cleavage/methylation domain-containing protein
MNDANDILINKNRWARAKSRSGFSLLEVLVAIVVLVAVMSIAFEVFNATIRGWKRGTEVAEGIKHGDFAMSQLTAALNSTIYFSNSRKVYAFLVEKDSLQGLPADMISFVTASGAFMPYDSPFAKGPHRLKLFVDIDDNGDPALYAVPMPAVANPDDIEDEYSKDPLLVSRGVSGLQIFFWDADNEEWTEEWEPENSIPERILIDLYISSADEDEEPIVFSRAIDIPVYDSVKERLKSPASS